MVELSILGEVGAGEATGRSSKAAAFDFWEEGFEVFGTLAGRVHWNSVLKRKGVQEGRLCLSKEVLEAQEQAVLLCYKMRWQR